MIHTTSSFCLETDENKLKNIRNPCSLLLLLLVFLSPLLIFAPYEALSLYLAGTDSPN